MLRRAGSSLAARAGFLLCVVLCAAASQETAASQEAAAGPLSFEAALQRAAGANPAIAAARLRRAIDVASLGVAREPLNPEARVEFERETPKRSYGIALPIELGGKRARRIAVGEAAIRTGEAELAQAMVEMRASVRRAYFGAVVGEARLAVLQELSDFAVRAQDAARQRFDAGSAPRLDLLQAGLAAAEAANDVTAARATADAARVQLNALLALPLDAHPALTTPLDAPPSEAPAVALARARAVSVELAAIDRRIDEQRARLALAHAMQVPDVTPEAFLTRGAEPEFATGWRASAGVTLPLFTRHRAGVRLEEATLAQLTAERDAAAARITGAVASAATLAEAQRQQYIRYRDEILPRAREVEEMAEDSYKLGQTGVLALLQALQASRDARLRAIQAASDLQDALTELDRAVGAPLP